MRKFHKDRRTKTLFSSKAEVPLMVETYFCPAIGSLIRNVV